MKKAQTNDKSSNLKTKTSEILNWFLGLYGKKCV